MTLSRLSSRRCRRSVFCSANAVCSVRRRWLQPRSYCSLSSPCSSSFSQRRLGKSYNLVSWSTRLFASLPSHTKITMPALSPTMEEGTIAKWLKKEGDEVAAGDILAEIETDKATVDFDSVEEGYLAKILVAEGTAGVRVGTEIAVMVEDESEVGAFANYSAGDQPFVDAPSSVETASAPSADSLPSFSEIGMPALSPTMETGRISRWMKNVGDRVEAGDVIAEIETDKATVDFEAVEEGFVARIFVEEGTSDIAVGQPIAVLVDEEGDIEAFTEYTPGNVSVPSSSPKESAKLAQPSASPEPISEARPPTHPGQRVFSTPFARRLARQAGLNINNLVGTGPNGRVVAADVTEFQASGVPSMQPAATDSASVSAQNQAYVDIPLSQMRKVIAQRLSESKQNIPHYYLTTSICADEIENIRKTLNSAANNEYKISVNDFIVKAAAAALKEVPVVNSSWRNDSIREYRYIDINVAVSTDTGLMTPIVADANLKGLRQISDEVKLLASKAREGKLAPAEYQGGTFTISNLGMMGVSHFSAIINPPQAAILAIGAVQKEIIPERFAEGEIKTSSKFTATLSCDHRVVDGAVGATWLQSFKRFCQQPLLLLM